MDRRKFVRAGVGAIADLAHMTEANYRAIDVFGAAQKVYFAHRPTPLALLEGVTEAQRKARDKAEAEARRLSGYCAADEAQKAACEAESAAIDVVLECPAPDLPAIITKIDMIREFDRPEALDHVAADLQRLYGT